MVDLGVTRSIVQSLVRYVLVLIEEDRQLSQRDAKVRFVEFVWYIPAYILEFVRYIFIEFVRYM